MSTDPSCIFCRIVAGESPSSVVFRDDSCHAFLDVGPLAEGHLLVVPLNHYAHLSEMPAGEAAALAAHLPRLGRALRAATGAAGYNLLCNEGRVAGQEVMHVHFHLIPRKAGDGLGYRWNAGKYAPGRADEVLASMKSALVQLGE